MSNICLDKELYKEKFRPQIHFSPKENWMNDPNGLVYYRGEYHLFYQYYPYSNVWGPMHWGHAISKDLLYWNHLDIALEPDEKTGMAFSGSAVVDYNDSSGFFDGDSGLVIIYTSTLAETLGGHQQQSIAYSKDNGRSWKKFRGNPVIENKSKKDFRDPKVFWHQESQKWVMVLAAGDHVEFYNSDDLKSWNYLSDFGAESGAHEGIWECPDLFSVKIKGHSLKYLWILKVDVVKDSFAGGSGGQYFIGYFDGKNFTEIKDKNKIHWLDFGQDFYAAQSWNDLAQRDKKIWLGWMSNWDYAKEVPTGKWRGAMSIPRELELIKENKEFKLIQNPISEFKELREPKFIGDDLKLNIDDRFEFKKLSSPLELIVDLELAKSTKFSFSFKFNQDNLGLKYNNKNRELILNRNAGSNFHPNFRESHSLILDESNNLKLQIFIDWSSIEIFINDGRKVITSLIFPEEIFLDFIINNLSEKLVINRLKIFELDSIW